MPLWVEVLCSDRKKVAAFLAKQNIEVRFFPPNLNDTSYFRSQSKKYPNSDVFARYGLFLPSGSDQKLKNIERTIYVLNKLKSMGSLKI